MLSEFPFLLGRAFIEAITRSLRRGTLSRFPFLLGRAFIEALPRMSSFPTPLKAISLPFGKGFH